MYKKFARGIAFLVSVLMLLSLFACGGDQKDKANETSAAGAQTSMADGASAGTSKVKEPPVTLTVMGFATNPDGTGPMDNPVAKLIEEETGVIMDLISTTEQDAQKQLPTFIASNDLPDLFFIPETDTKKYIDMMVKGGQIKPLDDMMSQYAPNLMSDKMAQASIELKKLTLSPDGKLYTIGMGRGTFDSGLQPVVGQFIRWDLYKQLGYPEMKSYDTDLLNVLAEMQKLEPKNNEGQKVYAVGAWFGDSQGWGDWHITYNLAYAEGYNCLTPGDRILYSDIATNKVVPSNAQKDKNSLFWRQAKWYNKARQMGILDPDSFTQKADQYEQKVKTGRYLFFNPGWFTDKADKYFEDAGQPDKGFTCLPPIGTDKFTLYRYFISGQSNYGISSNCKYPEKALGLLDWLSSYKAAVIGYNGPEGTNWNMENGKPVPTDEYLKADRSSIDFQKTGVGVLDHMLGYCYATVDPSTGVPVQLTYSEKGMASQIKPYHKDMLAHFGAASMPELYESKAPGGSKDMTLYNLGSLPDDLAALDTKLQAYEFKNIFKCILAKDDAEFSKLQDEYIKGLDAFKIDDIYNYWTSVAQKQEKELAPVLDLIK